jgi:hypothetical protein
MRLFVQLPHELATALITRARHDHRSPRQEAEWLLCKAIEEATSEQERTQMTEALEDAHATAQ